MKQLIIGCGLALASLSAPLHSEETREEAKEKAPKQDTIIFVVDAEDEVTLAELEKNKVPVIENAETLDELLSDLQGKRDLSRKHKRVDRETRKDQISYLNVLEGFVHAEFDPEDDEAFPLFTRIKDQIVNLIFGAPNEKEFYQRIWLLNTLWLNHQEEFARFESLDRALKDRSLEIEEKRQRIQRYITTTGSIVGALAGGFLTYKMSSKVTGGSNNGVALILKWTMRGSMIVVGAAALSSLGWYGGFLLSNVIAGQYRDYIDPIEGDDELTELLDAIEEYPY